MDERPPAPLAGVVVADFSRVLAAPLATMTLADLGADVIKVERPVCGDDTRAWGPPWCGDDSTYYLTVNRNKRSLALDLEIEADRLLAHRLAMRADVLVENFRPGVMEGFGLGRDALRRANPRLVYCTIAGFSSRGAGAELPGYDLLVQALSGVMSVTGEPDGAPLKVGVAAIDMIAGLYATTAIVSALQDRHRTGSGAVVDVSLMDAGLAALLNLGSAYLNAGVIPGRLGSRHPSIAPYQSIRAADGMFVIAVGNDRTWQRACSALGLEHLASAARYATNADRVAHVDEIAEAIEACTATQPAAHWVERLTAAGVPAGLINDVGAAFDFAAGLGLDSVMVQERPGHPPIRSVRSPMLFDGRPLPARRPPPFLDEHGAEVRQWLSAED